MTTRDNLEYNKDNELYVGLEMKESAITFVIGLVMALAAIVITIALLINNLIGNDSIYSMDMSMSMDLTMSDIIIIGVVINLIALAVLLLGIKYITKKQQINLVICSDKLIIRSTKRYSTMSGYHYFQYNEIDSIRFNNALHHDSQSSDYTVCGYGLVWIFMKGKLLSIGRDYKVDAPNLEKAYSILEPISERYNFTMGKNK